METEVSDHTQQIRLHSDQLSKKADYLLLQELEEKVALCATINQQSQVEALFDEYTTKVDMKKF